jgi:hypothetical protein
MYQPPLFKLDQNPEGKGLRCDPGGLFFRGNALLQRNEEGNFEARSDVGLRKSFGSDANLESRIRSVKLVANALNNGEMARAMMTAVLMRLPDPTGAVRVVDAEAGLAKAGYNPDEPRDERGRWTTGGDDHAEASTAHRDPRIQLAGDFRSDASNDPMAVAAARAAEAQRNSRATRAQTRPPGNQLESFWQTISANVLRAAREVGQAEVINSRGNLAADEMEAHAIADAFRAYTGLMEYKTGGSMPITPETPIWGYGASARNAPERPIELGDYVNPAAAAFSIVPADEILFGATQASRLLESENQAFIVLPRELSRDFDIRLPVGRYKIPENAVPGTTKYGDLVHEQIAGLIKERLPDANPILRVSPGMKGVDIELPEIEVPELGARYIEIKPLTESGFKRFRANIARWKLAEPVLPLTYDYDGNIYYGFPK